MFHVSKETKWVIPLANSLLQYTFHSYRAHRSYSRSDKGKQLHFSLHLPRNPSACRSNWSNVRSKHLQKSLWTSPSEVHI